MPQPTQTDVHVDAILTNISTAYLQNQRHFIAQQVFPVVPVDKQSDKYYTFTKGDWFRDEAQVRPDSTESAGSGYNVSTDSYLAEVYAIHKDVGDQVVANSDSPLNPFRDAAEFVTQRMLLRQEIQWATDFFGATIWDTDLTPTNLWDDFAASDPINDVEVGKKTILQNTGMDPNTMVLGYDTFIALKQHPDIIDRIKYTTNAATNLVTESLLAGLWGLDRVLVAKAVKNTGAEGAANSFSFTHGKHALLMYVNPRPSLLAPSAGYTFMWRGVSQGLGANVGITRFRMEHLKADRVEAQMAWDNKVVGTDLGYFFNGAVS